MIWLFSETPKLSQYPFLKPTMNPVKMLVLVDRDPSLPLGILKIEKAFRSDHPIFLRHKFFTRNLTI
jgi:hypothetical protein